MRIVLLITIVTIIGGCRGVGELYPDKPANEPVSMISEENRTQVFSHSVSGPSRQLYMALCSIRIPYFHVTEAAASDILKLIEDVYNEFSNPILPQSADPKPKQSIFDLSGMKSNVLSYKITRYIEDITLMRMSWPRSSSYRFPRS